MAMPGWYPDPHDSRRRRWFDGTGWTGHSTPVETVAGPQPYAGYPMAFGSPPAAAPNTTATAGLTFGILSVFLAPLMGVMGIIGIALSAFGLAHARSLQARGLPPDGRAKAQWGLGTSIVGTVLGLVVLAAVLGSSGSDHRRYDSAAVEQNITAGLESTAPGVTVECPSSTSTAAGSVISCVARLPGGSERDVVVTFGERGSWTWVMH
ncbi:DUF2510 domain-containing protein [Cellulomonas sp. McL0617]|uniref:DUF2510 domain-containing protein n=1 Tax=Cellulomonas sp. McL0617 TaxID=3415675 RepID=UPI003CF37B09